MIDLHYRTYDLALRHTFRLSRGASDSRRNLFLELEHEGLVGLGEAAPIARYHQDAASATRAAETLVPRLGDGRAFRDAAAIAASTARAEALSGEAAEQTAAQAAVDMALWDLAGKRMNAPLYELLGLAPGATPPTSFTIGMDAPEIVAEKVREAADFEILKIKLGSPDDRAMLEAVRDVTDRPLRVDANEGWSLEDALAKVEWLASLGVELVEQPFPAHELEQTRELRRHSPLPLFADESVGKAADIPRLAGAFDGINIKLMKCGSLQEALNMIAVARAHGLKVMLGCMVESSLAITAAAHLSPLVDHADLDGNLLITNDPFVGATVVDGRLRLPNGPGLGVCRRREGPA